MDSSNEAISQRQSQVSDSMTFATEEADGGFQTVEASPSLVEKTVTSHKSKNNEKLMLPQHPALRVYLDM